MAMRIYTRAELEHELQAKWKLTPTEHATSTTRAWKTPKGMHVLVPLLSDDQGYPDYLLNKVLEQLEALNEHPFKTTK